MTISRVDDQPESKRKERKNKSGSMRYSSEDDDDIKRFHGDGLVVRMHSNHRALEIMGDGCRIVLTKNSGKVHIFGDGCSLRVNHNVGDIEYIGDGGRVLLGSDSSKGKVKFVGDGGKVILDSNMRSAGSRGRNREVDCVERISYSCKEIVREVSLGYEETDRTSHRDREELDNIMNDMKEKSQGKYGKRNEETRKSTRHPTVAKIITKIQSDGQCVRKRFDESSLIVNTHNDEPSVTKNLSRTSVTNVKIK
ncbi:uncharacterized protein LOC114942934 [Nylanderia fulva]|uniref:uncharacterized protein LOC114942934 n=1 Tax=Nylanderia fulva TaxID=613905 RepID=UPI0010FAF8D4|nr:uncharacterized protein LOC114942934 [Nylanderia fulva]